MVWREIIHDFWVYYLEYLQAGEINRQHKQVNLTSFCELCTTIKMNMLHWYMDYSLLHRGIILFQCWNRKYKKSKEGRNGTDSAEEEEDY